MIERKYKGFVLSKTKYKDNDAIINILTSDGKVSFKAVGINKITSKNASKCNFFMISEFVLNFKSEISNKTLKQASIEKLYKKPYDDLLASSCYLLIVSILNCLDDINGYDMAIKCFDMIEDGIYPINVINYFIKNVIEALGYLPENNKCVMCGIKSNIISFDFESGGFICNKCFDKTRHIKYSKTILTNIHNIFASDDIVIIDKLDSVTIYKIFTDYLKEIIQIKEDNYQFVLKCL